MSGLSEIPSGGQDRIAKKTNQINMKQHLFGHSHISEHSLRIPVKGKSVKTCGADNNKRIYL